jgi:hypothetical protein
MFHGLAYCRYITYPYNPIIYTSGVEETVICDLDALLPFCAMVACRIPPFLTIASLEPTQSEKKKK